MDSRVKKSLSYNTLPETRPLYCTFVNMVWLFKTECDTPREAGGGFSPIATYGIILFSVAKFSFHPCVKLEIK